ncbi:MAG: NUDIX domain-containing protein [Thiomicrorhabdus sp.]|jgi:ADP-ribose pyrophosphatase|nr:NUDIX domain-containing protein [Thiomicrorhabdus sp.]
MSSNIAQNKTQTTMNTIPEKTLNIQLVKTEFQGFFKVQSLLFKHSLYQGGCSPEIKRELFCRGEAVVVLLYDSNLKQIVLVEQCRPGALQHAQQLNQPDQAWLLEPVAGMIDLGETAVEAGIRESREEAGIEVLELEYVCQFYTSPGGCDEVLHLYAADICANEVSEFAGLADDHEDIRVIKLAFTDAKRMLLNAEFNVASTYIALQWLFFQKLAVQSLD